MDLEFSPPHSRPPCLLLHLLYVVGKEEQFKHDEYDHQLYADNQPERFSERHIAETIVVQMECLIPKAMFFHLH